MESGRKRFVEVGPDILKGEYVKFRVTPIEKKLITQRGEDCGLSTSDFLRRLALGKPTRSRIAATIINELREIHDELKLHFENGLGKPDLYRDSLINITLAIEKIGGDINTNFDD